MTKLEMAKKLAETFLASAKQRAEKSLAQAKDDPFNCMAVQSAVQDHNYARGFKDAMDAVFGVLALDESEGSKS